MYDIKSQLHPLTMIVVVGLVEINKSILESHDIEFIDSMWPYYEDKWENWYCNQEFDFSKAVRGPVILPDGSINRELLDEAKKKAKE